MILPCLGSARVTQGADRRTGHSGERIELEHFIVVDVQTIERAANRLLPKRHFRKITVRTSKALREKINSE